jgi:hypothetical protein
VAFWEYILHLFYYFICRRAFAKIYTYKMSLKLGLLAFKFVSVVLLVCFILFVPFTAADLRPLFYLKLSFFLLSRSVVYKVLH